MNHFRLFKDVPRIFDAWDIDSNYTEQEITAAEDVHCEIEETGGFRAVLRVSGRIAHSVFTQRIILEAQSERILFETQIDWQELHRLLKVSFPVNVYATEGINEMQFGCVRRPTMRSTQYERGPEFDLIPLLKENGILPMAYSSLGSDYYPHDDIHKNKKIMSDISFPAPSSARELVKI